jgi:phytoene dehydrogenase-like protein
MEAHMPEESGKASARINIAGGGIAGLIAAIELARSGASVRVFEGAADPGGRARTKHADGFSLNQGPHAVYKGAFLRTLKGFGIAVSGSVPKPNPPQGIWRGKLHTLPYSAGSLALTSLFGVRDKMQFARVYQALADGATGEGSFADWLDSQRLRPAVRASLEALARVATYTNAPGEMRAAAALDQIRLGIRGVIYVAGGWSSIVESLKVAAVAAGADIRTGAPVERVTVEGRQSRMILADKSEHIADATLLALGPREASELARNVASLTQHAAEAIPVRANTLDLALERLPDGASDFALGIDRPTYFSLHSKAAKLAPEGGAVVHIAKYLPTDEMHGCDAIEELEEIADIAMPGWRPLEKRRQALRGMTVSNALVRWDRGRPGVELADAPGLFIAGDWVGEHGMLSDASAASAVAAAAAIRTWLAAGEVSRSAA